MVRAKSQRVNLPGACCLPTLGCLVIRNNPHEREVGVPSLWPRHVVAVQDNEMGVFSSKWIASEPGMGRSIGSILRRRCRLPAPSSRNQTACFILCCVIEVGECHASGTFCLHLSSQPLSL